MAMPSPTTQKVEPQKVDDTAATNNSAAAPRKRRRRAPATGASEDCFACRKRNVKCDRRRPYCGPCIELGKECTGYRTTLTWGVGVASRGKLRGLSLPIPKSPTNPSTTQTTATRDTKTQPSKAAAAASTPPTAARQDPTKLQTRHSIDYGVHSPTSPTSPNLFSAPQEYQYLSATSPIPIPSPTTPMVFHMPVYGEHVDSFHSHSSKLRHPHYHRGPLQRLQTSLAVPYEDNGLSASSASLGTYSDSDFPSPGEYPGTPDDFPFSESSAPQYNSLAFHDQTHSHSIESFHYHEGPRRSLPMADDISSSISSDQSVQDFAEMHAAHQNMGPPTFPDIFIEGEMSSSVNGLPNPSSMGGLPNPGFSYLPTEESYPRYAPFPADAMLPGLLRQIYMPGDRGF
jgi:hypothetical protein